MSNMEEFYEAFHYISQHPRFMFNGEIETFPHGLDIMVVKINPETLEIDDDEVKNTKIQVLLEHGPYEQSKAFDKMSQPTHDINLDCAGDTFEEAIIDLARLIKEYYPHQEQEARE